MGASYNLGVLFVHGIGDRPQGSTLVEFATPLCEWIQRRAQGADGDIEVVEANLCPGAGSPAHAVARVRVNGATREWLLAEAWWSQAFQPPRFRDVARWGFEVIPWTFGSHFGARLRSALQAPEDGSTDRNQLMRRARIAYAVLSMVGGLLASLVAMAVVALMLVVVLVPIRRVREAVGSLQRKIAATLGDSFVLIGSPITESAIVSEVQRTIRWMRDRGCDEVAVVAHSQGGAVAVRALDSGRVRADRLITFGSGLRKLEELTELRRNRQYGRPASLALLGLLLVAVALVVAGSGLADVRLQLGGRGSTLVAASVLAAGLALLSTGTGGLIRSEAPAGLRRRQARMKAAGVAWLDLYASHDPVPNGGLFAVDREPPTGHEITNLRSMLRDHNSYWQNCDEFVPRVGSEVVRADPDTAALALTEDDLRERHDLRRARNLFRQGIAWVTAASVVAVVFAHVAGWREIVAWLLIAARVQATSLFTSTQPSLPSSPSVAVWAETAGWVAVLLALHLVTQRLWSRWNRISMERDPAEAKSSDDSQPTWVTYLLAIQIAVALIAVFGADVPVLVLALAAIAALAMSFPWMRASARPSPAAAPPAAPPPPEGPTPPVPVDAGTAADAGALATTGAPASVHAPAPTGAPAASGPARTRKHRGTDVATEALGLDLGLPNGPVVVTGIAAVGIVLVPLFITVTWIRDAVVLLFPTLANTAPLAWLLAIAFQCVLAAAALAPVLMIMRADEHNETLATHHR